MPAAMRRDRERDTAPERLDVPFLRQLLSACDARRQRECRYRRRAALARGRVRICCACARIGSEL